MALSDCSCCWETPCRAGGAKFDESDMRMMPLPRLGELVAMSRRIFDERNTMASLTASHDRKELTAE
ncbi:hypothetical protein RVBP21_0920 [Pseudomonas phage BRkr]|nr:hypothetical protein RVBP21_0920 [Pseudomonas phage BRkr]